MFSLISLPVPSQQMTMFFMDAAPQRSSRHDSLINPNFAYTSDLKLFGIAA
jgi:hypothetical protein